MGWCDDAAPQLPRHRSIRSCTPFADVAHWRYLDAILTEAKPSSSLVGERKIVEKGLPVVVRACSSPLCQKVGTPGDLLYEASSAERGRRR